MSITTKWLLTAAVCIIALLIGLLNPQRDHAGSDRLWHLGAGDPLRNFLFQRNGAFRGFTKVFLLAWLAVGVCLLWMLG